MPNSLPLAFLVGALALASSPVSAQLKEIPEPASIAGFGTGQVGLEASVPKAGSVVFRITNTLPGVGALLVDADNGDHLVLITASGGARLAASALDSRKVVASLTLGGADLDGVDLKLAAFYESTGVRALRLTIFRNDGLVVPFTFTGASPAKNFQLVAKLNGTECENFQGRCGSTSQCPECNTPIIQCCGRPRNACVYCPACAILCQPCDGGPVDCLHN